MDFYLVGGAVRDRLLGLDGSDRDYVVVGSTAAQMLAGGFKQVGKDFPVFLHAQTGEEYALARTERKTAPGYRGFAFDADSSVSLEDDLARRDFTINAIAEDAQGQLIDPHGGVRDLHDRVLRHVSPAFAEDPVRILRGARFMARFASLGFTVAPETLRLMQAMVAAGEADHLVAERVWQELQRALAEATPSACLRLLRECGALQRLLPEVDALFGVPQRAEYHPEIDAGVHTLMVCDVAARLARGNARVGFAALTHDLGKALTPDAQLPRHINHEHAGLLPLRGLCDRYKVPSDYRQLAIICCREHLNIHRIDELRPETVHDLIARCDGFRQPSRIAELALVCEADKRGRLGREEDAYPQAGQLLELLRVAQSVDSSQLDLSRVSGPQIGEALRQARIVAIREAQAAARRDQAGATGASDLP